MSQNEEAGTSHLSPLKFYPPDQPSGTDEKEEELVFLPGYQDFPVRGLGTSTATRAELDNLKLKWDIHFRVFDMEKEEDRRVYETLMTAAGRHPWVRVIKEVWAAEHPGAVPATQGPGQSQWKVGVKWGEAYLEPPDKGQYLKSDSPAEE